MRGSPPETGAARALASFLGLPIAFDGALLGVLSLLGRAPFKLGVGERRRLEAFVPQAAAAIRNARHFAASEAGRRSAEAVAEDNARLYDEARRRQHAAETLARLAQTLTESLDVGDVGRRIVESVLPVFDVRSAGLRLIEPDGSLVTVARSAAAGMHSVPGNVVPAGTGISGRAIADGRPVRTPNLLDDPGIVVTPHMRAQAMASGERAMLAVPLCVKGRVIGSLSVADREGRVFLDADAALLQGFADQAALALENARLFGEAERRRREAELLAQLARSVNESLDLDVVLQRIAGAVQELCHSDIARIAMHDPAAGAMMFRYWAGAAAGDWLSICFEPGKGLGGHVLLTGRPDRTDDYVNDRRFTGDYLQRAVKEGIAAMMCVPIAIAGSIEGLVFAINRGTRSFTDHDEAVLVRLADQAAIAIHNAQRFTREQRARADAEASERALSDSEAQLRTSEERYRALVEHAPDAIVVFDPKSDRFVDVNEQAVRLARLTREELLQRGLLELSPTQQPDGRSSLEAGRDWYRQALKGAKPTFEWTHLDAGGSLVPCEVSLVRLPDRVRPLIRASIFDITARKRAEQDHRRLEDQLRQAQKMEAIGRLAGGVAHDFNNLLTVIIGYGELSQQTLPADDPAAAIVDEIRSAAERAAALTRQLLAFSRQQVARAEGRSTSTRSCAMAERMLRRLIGEDIDARGRRCAARPGHVLGPTRRSSSTGPHEPGGQRPRRHAAAAARSRIATRERRARREPLATRGRALRPGRYVTLDGRATPASAWTPTAAAPHLRALLHHQGGGQGHRARARDRLRHRQAEPGLHLGRQRAGQGHALHDLPAAAPRGGGRERGRRPRSPSREAPRPCSSWKTTMPRAASGRRCSRPWATV